jgi:hypothetical protein
MALVTAASSVDFPRSEAHTPNIRNGLQFEDQIAFLAGSPNSKLAGRAVGRGG